MADSALTQFSHTLDNEKEGSACIHCIYLAQQTARPDCNSTLVTEFSATSLRHSSALEDKFADDFNLETVRPAANIKIWMYVKWERSPTMQQYG
jgi:hypothetical protein